MALSGADFGMGVSLELLDGFTNPANKIAGSFNRLEAGINKGGQSIQNTFSDITDAFAGAAAGFAIAAPFGVAIKAAMDFDAVMSDVGAKAGATAAEMKILREEAIRLGDATTFSAIDAAKGQALLGQAGFSTQQIMSALPATLSLASAGQLELAEATDIAVGVMSGFQLKATDIARVSDVLAMGANKSTTSVQQIGEAMKFLAPTAAALKIPLEEATAAVQILANAGLTGSIATQSLGSALAGRLTAPSKEAARAMQSIKFDAFNDGQFIGMAGMIESLTEKTKNLTQEQKLGTLTQIFGAESLKQVLILMEQEAEVMKDGRLVTLKGAEALKFFTKENENAAGSAERMSKMMLDNLTGDVGMLSSAIDTALIHAGSAFTGILRPAVQLLADMVSGINKMMATNLGKNLVLISGGLALVVGGMTALGAVLPVLKTGFIALRAASLAAMTTMLPVVLAVGAVAAGAIMAYQAVNEFNAVMDGAKAATGFTGFLQKTGGLIKGVIAIFQTWNGQTFSISKNMEQSLKRIGMLDFFLTVSTWVVRGIELFKGFGETVGAAFERMRPAVRGLGDAFGRLWAVVNDLFPAFGAALGGVDAFKDAGKLLGEVYNTFVLGPLQSMITKIWYMVTAIEAAIKAFGILKDVAMTDMTIGEGLGKIADLRSMFSRPKESFIGAAKGPLLSMQAKEAQPFFLPDLNSVFKDGRQTGGKPSDVSGPEGMQSAVDVTTQQKRSFVLMTTQQQQEQNATREMLKHLNVNVMLNEQVLGKAMAEYNENEMARQ